MFAILGIRVLAQLFNPVTWTMAILELLEVMVLGRIRRTDTFPIYRGLIEDRAGRRHQFLLRGPIALGNLIIGHQVGLTGLWRGGNFLAFGGNDLTSNSAITSTYRNRWRVIFYVLLGLYVLIGGYAILNLDSIRHFLHR